MFVEVPAPPYGVNHELVVQGASTSLATSSYDRYLAIFIEQPESAFTSAAAYLIAANAVIRSTEVPIVAPVIGKS